MKGSRDDHGAKFTTEISADDDADVMARLFATARFKQDGGGVGRKNFLE